MKKFSLFISLLASGAAIQAQVLAGSSFFNEIVSDWHMGFTADTTAAATLPADISDGGNGDLGVYDFTGLVKFQGVHQNKDFLNVDGGYKYSYFDFSDYDAGFSSVNKIFGRLFYQRAIDENWSVFGMGIGSFAAASNGNLGDGGSFYGGIGASYAFSKDLRLGLGVGGYSRMDRNWTPMPIGYLEWTINKHLSLRTFAGIALIYDVFADGQLLINLSCEYENSYIRLDEVFGMDRSVRDSYYQVAFGATYKITPKWYVSASIAGNFGRELTFRTAGNKSAELDISAAPAFFFHAGYLF